MDKLIQRVELAIQEQSLIGSAGDVLVAVSGGLDSMVLLDVLVRLSRSHRWRLSVAHFNHQLRGCSSEADQRLVQRTCRRLQLRCALGAADVRRLAARDGVSIEMVARTSRHAFLARVANRWSISTIALAHHADDQVELFLLRLLRGAGSEGLSGMRWTSPSPANASLKLIRPLLETSKSELSNYATEIRVQFREDASNASTDHLRNRVRQELIPLLSKNYQPSLTRVLLRNAEILEADASCLEQMADEWRTAKARVAFKELPLALQRRVILKGLIKIGSSPEFHVIERLRMTVGLAVVVRSALVVCHDGNGNLSLVSEEEKMTRHLTGETSLFLDSKKGEGTFDGLNWSWQVQDQTKRQFPRFTTGTEFFDADLVGDQVVLRHWRPGDRFQPSGLGKAAKLQDLFVNAKIPASKRRSLTVATTSTGEIWWVEGLRIAERFKLIPATKRRLKWFWCRPDAGQGTTEG